MLVSSCRQQHTAVRCSLLAPSLNSHEFLIYVASLPFPPSFTPLPKNKQLRTKWQPPCLGCCPRLLSLSPSSTARLHLRAEDQKKAGLFFFACCYLRCTIGLCPARSREFNSSQPRLPAIPRGSPQPAMLFYSIDIPRCGPESNSSLKRTPPSRSPIHIYPVALIAWISSQPTHSWIATTIVFTFVWRRRNFFHKERSLIAVTPGLVSRPWTSSKRWNIFFLFLLRTPSK